MRECVKKLLTVKSIVTLTLTAAFSYLALTERVGATEFLTIFTTIIAFYFGTQTARRDGV
ncbi:MAG: hypothetical protein IJT18_07790 [Oscillospiraceae bacterium]|nr:hypothetical protein [Oscillospiraceae bacterium]